MLQDAEDIEVCRAGLVCRPLVRLGIPRVGSADAEVNIRKLLLSPGLERGSGFEFDFGANF